MSITSRRVKITTAVASSVLTLGLVTSAAAPALAAPVHSSTSASYSTSAVHVAAAKKATKITTVAKVAISGTSKTNSKLTAKVSGHWKAGKKTIKPKLAYQWYQNGHAIRGAKSSTYKISPTYVKAKISVNVTASLKGYTTKTIKSKTTSAVAAIAQSAGTFTTALVSGAAGSTSAVVRVSLSRFTAGSTITIILSNGQRKTIKILSNGTGSTTFSVTIFKVHGMTTTFKVTVSSSAVGYIVYNPRAKTIIISDSYVAKPTITGQH